MEWCLLKWAEGAKRKPRVGGPGRRSPRRPGPGRCARTAGRRRPCGSSSSCRRRRSPRSRSRRRASTALSSTSTPSIPAGGTAFRSIDHVQRLRTPRRILAGSSTTPAAPAAITSVAARPAPSGRRPTWPTATASTAGVRQPGAGWRRTRPAARSCCREPTRTCAPCRASSRATRCPTGPVPPRTSALRLAEVQVPGRGADGGGGGRVRPVGVEHDRHASARTAGCRLLADLGEHRLARRPRRCRRRRSRCGCRSFGPRVKMRPVDQGLHWSRA